MAYRARLLRGSRLVLRVGGPLGRTNYPGGVGERQGWYCQVSTRVASVAARGSVGTLQQERAARNEALFREINDRLARLNEAVDEHSSYGTWMCECQDTDCHEPIEMTLVEYRGVRAYETRFVVVAHAAHFYADLERVVEETDHNWVVEKIGAAGEIAAELDADSDVD
jgi:hypothetical protein